MATSSIGLDKHDVPAPRGSVVTWIATILACAYIAWAGVSLYQATGIFKEMYTSMGVELSTPTRFIMAAYRWLFPILFGGVIGVVVAKQFLVREKWVSLFITLAGLV